MGNNIRKFRRARGWSLNELADKVGTTNQQISHLELSKRRLTVDWLIRVAAALGCRPTDLAALENQPNKREEQLLDLFRSLTRRRQKQVIDLAASLADLKPTASTRGGH